MNENEILNNSDAAASDVTGEGTNSADTTGAQNAECINSAPTAQIPATEAPAGPVNPAPQYQAPATPIPPIPPIPPVRPQAAPFVPQAAQVPNQPAPPTAPYGNGYVPYQPVAPQYTYYNPYAVAPKAPGHGLAVASLVCGIISIVLFYPFGFILGLLGIIFGAVARSKGTRNGMTVAGIITGSVGIVLFGLIIALFVAIISGSYTDSDYYSYYNGLQMSARAFFGAM